MELRPLKVEDETIFRNAVEEFKSTIPKWEFAFHFDEKIPFSEYVNWINGWRCGVDLPKGFVPNSFYVAMDHGQIVGRISLGHQLNDWLARIGGHIGYGVVPSCRQKGYATQMLEMVIPFAKQHNIGELLITCDESNVASRRVIERNGGKFEGLLIDGTVSEPKRRYWIKVR